MERGGSEEVGFQQQIILVKGATVTQLPRVPIISEDAVLRRCQKKVRIRKQVCVVKDGSLIIAWKHGLCLGSSFFFLRFV